MCNDPTELTIIRWCFQARFDTSPRAALPKLMDFKNSREHFALDSLDSHADKPDDFTRLVSNQAKARAKGQVAGACANLSPPTPTWPTPAITPATDPAAGLALTAAQDEITQADLHRLGRATMGSSRGRAGSHGPRDLVAASGRRSRSTPLGFAGALIGATGRTRRLSAW